MSEQRFSFKPSELMRLSVECKKCGTKIVFDLNKGAHSVEHCPACHEHMPNLNRMLNDYRAFQEQANTEYFVVQLETAPVSN